MRQLFICLFYLVFSCSSTVSESNTPSILPIDHSTFDSLLQKHVSETGAVNYKGFIEDQTIFDAYLASLSATPPNKKTWSKEEQLAYWINAYNAFTIKLILNHYPVKSIKDIKKGVPFVNSVWDIKFFEIGGEQMDLNKIEHGEEPRIHFAVNCASYSCPALRNEAYTAERLEKQLTDATKIFLADTRKNNVANSERIVISKIFQWYSTDFTNRGFFSR